MDAIRNELYECFAKYRAKYEGSGYLVISQSSPTGNSYCFAALHPDGLYDSPLSMLYEFDMPESEDYSPSYRMRGTRNWETWSHWWKCD
jgi:hypothetical protein